MIAPKNSLTILLRRAILSKIESQSSIRNLRSLIHKEIYDPIADIEKSMDFNAYPKLQLLNLDAP